MDVDAAARQRKFPSFLPRHYPGERRTPHLPTITSEPPLAVPQQSAPVNNVGTGDILSPHAVDGDRGHGDVPVPSSGRAAAADRDASSHHGEEYDQYDVEMLDSGASVGDLGDVASSTLSSAQTLATLTSHAPLMASAAQLGGAGRSYSTNAMTAFSVSMPAGVLGTGDRGLAMITTSGGCADVPLTQAGDCSGAETFVPALGHSSCAAACPSVPFTVTDILSTTPASAASGTGQSSPGTEAYSPSQLPPPVHTSGVIGHASTSCISPSSTGVLMSAISSGSDPPVGASPAPVDSAFLNSLPPPPPLRHTYTGVLGVRSRPTTVDDDDGEYLPRIGEDDIDSHGELLCSPPRQRRRIGSGKSGQSASSAPSRARRHAYQPSSRFVDVAPPIGTADRLPPPPFPSTGVGSGAAAAHEVGAQLPTSMSSASASVSAVLSGGVGVGVDRERAQFRLLLRAPLYTGSKRTQQPRNVVAMDTGLHVSPF